MDNKKMVELKREILVTILMGDFNGVKYPIIKPEKENSYNTKMLDNELTNLLNEGLVEVNVKGGNGFENKIFTLTSRGIDKAEHLSNDDRWNETMQICGKLRDFSTNVVYMVYDELLKSDLYSHLPVNPITNAINQLSSDIRMDSTNRMLRN